MYLQLNQINLLCQESDVIATKYPIILTGIYHTQQEIFWYFEHYSLLQQWDKSPKKTKLEDGFIDSFILNLIQVVIELGTKLCSARSLLFKVKNPLLTHSALDLISKLIENVSSDSNANANSNSMELLQGIWKSLDSIYHTGADSNELECIRMNWVRLQCQFALSNEISPIYQQLVHFMTEIYEKSLLISDFENRFHPGKAFKGLFYHLSTLQTLVKSSICSLEHLDGLECLEFLFQNSIENATESWPLHFDYISSKTADARVEFYSVRGSLGAILSHEIALTDVSFACQLLPLNTILFYKKAPMKKPGKPIKPSPSCVTHQRPGWESVLKNPNPNPVSM